MAFDTLPKNSNGKIDRPRLKERFTLNEAEPPVPQYSGTANVENAAEPSSAIPKRLASQV